jgi:hypothetical protein
VRSASNRNGGLIVEREKRYGHGKWPRRQLYAIVGSYRDGGRTPAWVGARLGLSEHFVTQIFDHFEEQEFQDAMEADLEAEDAAERFL